MYWYLVVNNTCPLLNDAQKQPGPEGTQKAVAIQERRLHVGVHNGWCFLDKPQVVVLEPLASGGRGRADSTSKQITLDRVYPASRPISTGIGSSIPPRPSKDKLYRYWMDVTV
ncbi:unnamed protein product, partial [Pleuronectes platessa]